MYFSRKKINFKNYINMQLGSLQVFRILIQYLPTMHRATLWTETWQIYMNVGRQIRTYGCILKYEHI